MDHVRLATEHIVEITVKRDDGAWWFVDKGDWIYPVLVKFRHHTLGVVVFSNRSDLTKGDRTYPVGWMDSFW